MGHADALRRALESRTVTGYRPPGPVERAATHRNVGRGPAPGNGRRYRPRGPAGHSSRGPGPGCRHRGRCRRRGARRDRHGAGEGPAEESSVPDTGEPKIVQKVRGQFASWAAVSAGCFGINIATGIEQPWFLFPMFGMGIGLLRNYASSGRRDTAGATC